MSVKKPPPRLPADPLHLDSDMALRSDYYAVLQRLREEFPSTQPYVGRINPYNHLPIQTDEDFSLYLQQRALSIVYARRYIDEQSALQDKMSELQAELLASDRARRDDLRLHEQEKARWKHKRRLSLSVFFSCLLAFAFLIFSRDRPAAVSSVESRPPAASSSAAQPYTFHRDPDSFNVSVSTAAPRPVSPPAPTPAPTPPISGPDVSETVYITATGKKYHRDGCSYLSNSKIAISISDAISKGYTPCSRCW